MNTEPEHAPEQLHDEPEKNIPETIAAEELTGTSRRTESIKPESAPSIVSKTLKISRYSILGLLAVVTVSFYPVIKIFIIPIILAATFSTLFFPLYSRILKLFRGNQGVSSLVTCLVLFLCLVIPSYVVMHMVVLQMIHFYQVAEPLVKDVVAQGGNSELIRRIKEFTLIQWLNLESVDFVSVLSDSVKTFLSLSSKLINKTSAGFFGLFTTIMIMFFTMFYFFMDGEALVKKVKFLSPIRDDYEDLIISRFLMISRATVMGTVIIGITQGTFGAIALLVFGIKSWLLWGVVMVFLSLVPMVGAWLVLIPAGIIQLVTGHVWQGVGILVISTTLISNIDNLMRPRLVGREAKMHDLIIFFSSLGGIAAFGVMGFIVGPVIAALFISVLDIYSTEFEAQLKEANMRK